MRLIVVPLIFFFFLGKNSDQQDGNSLTKLLGKLKENVQKDRTKSLKDFPAEEKKIRFLALFQRDEFQVLNLFLSSNPKISGQAKERVQTLREISLQLAQFYEGLIKINRFSLTSEEKVKCEQLAGQFDKVLIQIGIMIDSKHQ